MILQVLAAFGLWIVGTHADCPTLYEAANGLVPDEPVTKWCTGGDWCNIWHENRMHMWKNKVCGCYSDRCWKWCGGLKWCWMRFQHECSKDSQCYSDPDFYSAVGCELNDKGQSDCGVGFGRTEITENLAVDHGELAIGVAVIALLAGGVLCLIRKRKFSVSAEYEPLIETPVAA